MPLVDPVTMSAAVAMGSSAQAADSKPKGTMAPVPVFNTPLAKGISFGRVAVLLSLLALRFDALVKDPASTLQTSIPVVALLQVAYAVVCLPVAGSSISKVGKKARPGEKKKAEGSVPGAIAVSSRVLFKLFLLIFIKIPMLSCTTRPLFCP